jgi:hypothetical protein
MKTLHTLALHRSDLGENFKDILLYNIEIYMFPFFKTGVMLHEDLIVFIDDDGNTRILKNRYGKPN